MEEASKADLSKADSVDLIEELEGRGFRVDDLAPGMEDVIEALRSERCPDSLLHEVEEFARNPDAYRLKLAMEGKR